MIGSNETDPREGFASTLSYKHSEIAYLYQPQRLQINRFSPVKVEFGPKFKVFLEIRQALPAKKGH